LAGKTKNTFKNEKSRKKQLRYQGTSLLLSLKHSTSFF